MTDQVQTQRSSEESPSLVLCSGKTPALFPFLLVQASITWRSWGREPSCADPGCESECSEGWRLMKWSHQCCSNPRNRKDQGEVNKAFAPGTKWGMLKNPRTKINAILVQCALQIKINIKLIMNNISKMYDRNHRYTCSIQPCFPYPNSVPVRSCL